MFSAPTRTRKGEEFPKNVEQSEALSATLLRAIIILGLYADLGMKDLSSTAHSELHLHTRFPKDRTRISPPTKPAQSALQDHLERLHAILRTAVEGIITIDERGVIHSV